MGKLIHFSGASALVDSDEEFDPFDGGEAGEPSAGQVRHRIAVSRSGNELTITFTGIDAADGGGDVQSRGDCGEVLFLAA